MANVLNKGKKMHQENKTDAGDLEIDSITFVYKALKDLDPEAQQRVINYVSSKLNLSTKPSSIQRDPDTQNDQTSSQVGANSSDQGQHESDDDLEGISPVAKKWIRRNDLDLKKLSSIFSLGIDEIDLVAKSIPGKGKKEKMHNVFILKGVAAYLGTGVARFKHDQVKEACLHYDAYDSANFAANLKTFAADVSGNKGTDYSLTSRGLASAADLIKQIG